MLACASARTTSGLHRVTSCVLYAVLCVLCCAVLRYIVVFSAVRLCWCADVAVGTIIF
jgi:hypothetical protein